jgi:hypothetical protein
MVRPKSSKRQSKGSLYRVHYGNVNDSLCCFDSIDSQGRTLGASDCQNESCVYSLDEERS